MPVSASIRSDRIDVRTNPEVKSIIERAAQLKHKTISAYILESVLEKAREDIRENENINLTESERESFFAALMNPPEPNTALKSLLTNP